MRHAFRLFLLATAAHSSSLHASRGGLPVVSSFLLQSLASFASNATTSESTTSSSSQAAGFTKLGEVIAWKGKYRQIKTCTWRFPDSQKTVDFDILTQGGQGSVVCFVFNRARKTVTLVREFHPGAENLQFGTINGMFERHKHSSPLECARMELEEEAQLQASEENWIPLLKDGKSMSFDKYSDNHFFPFLVLDATAVSSPRPQDDDEYILVEREMTYERIMHLIDTCQINVASSYCILLAYRKLDELGIPYR